MKSLLKRITNKTLKNQLLWQSLRTKNLAYGTKQTASFPKSAPYRPPLSLNGIPATRAHFQCLAITESQHILVPCVESSLNSTTHLTPLISYLQVLFWTLSWQAPPVLSDLSNTHDSIIAMIFIYVAVLFVCLTHQTANPWEQESCLILPATVYRGSGIFIE